MNTFVRRLATATTWATGGAAFGGLLAAAGSLIGTTPLGVGVTLAVAAVLGAVLGRVRGALGGLIVAGVLCAFGSLIGGSILGVVLTILGCALLAAWLRWAHVARQEASVLSGVDFRVAPEEALPVTPRDEFKKEMLLWN